MNKTKRIELKDTRFFGKQTAIICVITNYVMPKNNAVFLYTDTAELFCKASVNLPEALASDEVAIKNYSENEGILQELMRLNIISEPMRYIDIGYVTIPICKIL